MKESKINNISPPHPNLSKTHSIMSGRGRHRGHRNRQNAHQLPTLTSVARETAASFAPDSPVLAMFRKAAVQLNNRQDRHERLVKLSRDVTIESKRIIFLLHSAISKEDHEKVIPEALDRLNKLIQGPIKTIGIELMNAPAYLHSRAVSPGFQEFIEAYTLALLMKEKKLATWSDVQEKFKYTIKEQGQSEEEVEKTVTTLLTHTDYMLGLADLTGELMRRAINSISNGDSEECFYACQVVRDFYTGYLGLSRTGKELARKNSTTRMNVSKVESAVYALRVRGGEAPAKLLLQAPPPDWEEHHHDEDDEGCY